MTRRPWNRPFVLYAADIATLGRRRQLASAVTARKHSDELSVLETAALRDGTLDQAQRQRMAPTAWSPLGGGSLFDRSTELARRVGAVLDRVAAGHGADAGAVALGWLLRLPTRPVPVLGTSRLDRLRALARAESVDLDRQSRFELYEASLGDEVP